MSNPNFTNLDIDDAFENFMRQVHGGKVAESSVQYNESRRVFFCGVEQMFSFAMQLTALPDDEAERGLANIQKQLRDFAQRLKEDKA